MPKLNGNLVEGKTIPIFTTTEESEETYEEAKDTVDPLTKHVMLFPEKPTTFNGETNESFADWLNDYNQIAESNGWSDTEKLNKVSLYLKGIAKVFYKGKFGNRLPNSWKEFTEVTQKHFGPVDNITALDKMLSRQMVPGESVHSYIYEKLMLIKECWDNDADDEHTLNMIITGLLPELREKIKGKKFSKLDDLVAKLKAIGEPLNYRGTQFELLVNAKEEGNGPRLKCNGCKQYGHMIKDCKNCWKCGSNGHLKNECQQSGKQKNFKRGGLRGHRSTRFFKRNFSSQKPN